MKKTEDLTKSRRLLAIFIDIALLVIPLSLLSTLIIKIYTIIFNKEPYFEIELFLDCILFGILSYFLIRRDTLIEKQNRSIGKILMDLYIVDSNHNQVQDKDLLQKRNKLALLNFPFYILQVLLTNETESEKITNMYVVTKSDVNFEEKEEKA